MSAEPEAPQDTAPGAGARAHARYVIGARLAKGGMGEVFLARDRIARRDVVYKRLSLSEPHQRVLRTALFRREYDVLARLPHPNIVEVYDYGEDDAGNPFYVMERLGGTDLTGAAPLPLREACRILRDVASALALIHTRRLVHRDVSPNNVRLTDRGIPKLLDFGALAPFGPTKDFVGTPGFIAPESFCGAPLDQRSDLYSLGALAYWTLTRRTPYAARTLDELQAQLAHAPPPPSEYVAAIPAELDKLVLSLLAADPAARPADASYVIDRLTSMAALAPEADAQRVAQSYVAHPPLCGRDAVIRDLYAAIDAAREGHGSTLLIEGEAGFGRSALLAAAAQRAQLQGAVVLRARGDASADAFRVARTLVEKGVLLYPDLAPLAPIHPSPKLHPESAPRGGVDAVGVAERHAQLVASARSTLLEIASRSPLALIVDDVHQIDEQSLAMLASLAQAVDGRRVTLVLSKLREQARPDSPSYLKLAAVARRITLSPLSRTEVGDLIHALFGPVPNALKLAHWVYAQGGGNPATTLDLLRLLMRRELIRYTVGTFTLPFDLEERIASADLSDVALARLGGLRREVEQVVLALGLHVGPLTSDDLAAATALPLDEVLRALEELTLRGVVDKSDLGYQLLGSSLRAALRASMSDQQRRAMHLALARALLRNAASQPSLRYDASVHFLEAGRDDDALGLIVGRAHDDLTLFDAVRRADLLERTLARARAKECSREECLSLLIPVASAGFFGNAVRQAAHIETALTWLADLTGMTLARRLRRYVGPRVALLVGLVSAKIRHARTPKHLRLGSLERLLAWFVVLVCDAVALACAACDASSSRRFTAWLEPLAVLPKQSAGWILREFCLATCELAAGQPERGSARYAALVPLLARPIRGMEPEPQRNVYLGAINGRGLCEAALGSKEALVLADQLGMDGFYASFAEAIRFLYYAIRGDRESANASRHRAELLALQRGISWTASSSLAQCAAFAASLSGDAIGLVQVISEFERLSDAAPALRAFKRICEGWLEHIRGHSDRALAIFEEVIDSPEAEGLIFVVVNRSLYASVLNAVAQYARAEEVCARIADGPKHRGERSIAMRNVERQRAIAMAGQGRVVQAIALWERLLEEALPLDNPLELGLTHRDRARIAMLAGDRGAFDVHFAEMERYFQATRNPCLRSQSAALLAEAERRGVRVVKRSLPSPSLLDGDLDSETIVDSIATVG